MTPCAKSMMSLNARSFRTLVRDLLPEHDLTEWYLPRRSGSDAAEWFFQVLRAKRSTFNMFEVLAMLNMANYICSLEQLTDEQRGFSLTTNSKTNTWRGFVSVARNLYVQYHAPTKFRILHIFAPACSLRTRRAPAGGAAAAGQVAAPPPYQLPPLLTKRMRAKAAAQAAAAAVLAAHAGNQGMAEAAAAAAIAAVELAAADDEVNDDEDENEDEGGEAALEAADAAAEEEEEEEDAEDDDEQQEDERQRDEEDEDEQEDAARPEQMELSADGVAAQAAAAAPLLLTELERAAAERAAAKAARHALSAFRADVKRRLPRELRLVKNQLSVRDSFHKSRSSNSEGPLLDEMVADEDQDYEDQQVDIDAAAAAAGAAAGAGGAAPAAPAAAIAQAKPRVRCPIMMGNKRPQKQCPGTYAERSVKAFKNHLTEHVTELMAARPNWARESPNLINLLYAHLKSNSFAPFVLTAQAAAAMET